ncbi:MAG: hypothetical protein AAFR30_10975 [Cyanobacteria bacterium J06628_4]
MGGAADVSIYERVEAKIGARRSELNASQLAEYKAVRNWLRRYRPRDESNLARVRGYLEAFYHLSQVGGLGKWMCDRIYRSLMTLVMGNLKRRFSVHSLSERHILKVRKMVDAFILQRKSIKSDSRAGYIMRSLPGGRNDRRCPAAQTAQPHPQCLPNPSEAANIRYDY